MLRQKILEIIFIVFGFISIVFAITSCIYANNNVGLRSVSIICIVIALFLDYMLIILRKSYKF